MCDYSLMGLPSRLAAEGEELVVHRFSTGTIGMASPADLTTMGRNAIPAVCIPPGTELVLQDIPFLLRRKLHVSGTEEVTFTQITAEPHTHRDAVRFSGGREVRLQELSEGQRVQVVRIPSDDYVLPKVNREEALTGAW